VSSFDFAERAQILTGAKRHRRAITLVAVSLAFALVQLDATIVNVALQTLRAHLGGGVGAAQWAVDGYAVPFAACMLTAGALGDRYGHRGTCVAGFALFGLASAVAALAGGWPVLIGARAVQGVGAALMLPASLAMITELYPDSRERSCALGVWGGIATLGFASGPLLGGVLITVAGWPAIFWINLPIAAVVGGTIAVLGPRPRPRPRPINPVGTVLGTLALASLAAAIIAAGDRRASAAAGALALGIAAGWCFARSERRGPQPLIPVELTRSVRFRWSLLTGFSFNFAMYGALLCVSLTLQSAWSSAWSPSATRPTRRFSLLWAPARRCSGGRRASAGRSPRADGSCSDTTTAIPADR
jgi:MFS transporter, DHA2 family, methylenomycin A resistance protein